MKRLFTLFLAILLVVGLFIPTAVFSHAEATEISDYGGYSTILRKKGDGSILFSPYLTEVQNAVKAGAALSSFSVDMTFKLLSGNGGAVIYSFPTVTAAPQSSNGSYYDIFLKGTKGDCGFCPTVGKYYDIYVEVFKDGELFCFGTYQSLQAPSAYSSSTYYDPTPVEQPITLPYPGSSSYTYNGIRKKSSGQILFSPYIYELKQLISGGHSYSEYYAKLTFSLVEGGEVTATWNPVTANFLAGNGSYSDIVLQGSGEDCGFCPTAGATYNVYLEVYQANYDLELFYGTYENVAAASAISSSDYYSPSALPSVSTPITETTDGFTGTVYPGSAFISDDGGIYFAAYATELRNAIDGGDAIGDYTINLQISKIVNGTVFTAFQKILGAAIADTGTYFKVPLKTADVSLFCPEVSKTYKVAVEILKNDKVQFDGTYADATAEAGLSASTFYEPVTGAKEIESRTVYSSGIRQKSNGSILFSPFVAELRAKITAGAAYTDFVTKLTFTLLDNGTPTTTWAPVTVTLGSSNGQYFDGVLQGSGVDCGFCPTAEEHYNIYVEIYNQGELLFYGNYENIQAASAIAGSAYYRPTPDPNAPITYNMTLTYDFFNGLKGSAAGRIGVVSDGTGYHEICWADENDEKLTATIGGKTLSYTPLTTFVLSETLQSLNHTVLNFTAIPQGAKKLAAFDVNGTLITSIELPAAKLLDAEAYSYSFGVVSDIHYNYFHTDGVDNAIYAFDTALDFFGTAGVDLLTAVGDYSIYAEEASYQSYAAAVAGSNVLVLACGGNHELYAATDVMFGDTGLWRTYMNAGVYDETPIAGVLNVAPNGIDFVYEIPGQTDSVFIFLSQWYWDGHTAAQEHLVTPEQIDWLTEQFAEYADRTVYFYFHTYLFDDDGETFDGEGDLTGPAGYTYNAGYNMATEDEGQLRELLTQYKNVIFFNGHSHYLYQMQKYNPNLNIYDYEGTTATMVHVPSLTNPRLVTDTSSSSYSNTNGVESQAALMLVYGDYEIMNGINVWKDEILAEACYIIYNDKTDIVETTTSGDVTMIYDEQGQTLRFEGEGEIPAALITAAQSYASVVKNVYVCKGITAIPASAFAGFTALSRVEIKETVASIGDDAFSGCTALTTFVYGGSVVDYAEMTIGSGNAALTGAAISYDQYVITWVVNGETTTEQYRHYKVPTFQGKPTKVSADGTQIYSFTGWKSGSTTYSAGTNLPKVMSAVTYTAQFSDTATDRYVSGTLTGNTSITWKLDRFTGELVVTGTGAMDDFSRYNNTDNPNPAPWRAYVTDVTSVYVGNGITTVGTFAFADMTALQSVICGTSVTVLHADAFSYDSALTSIAFHAPITEVGQGTVYSSGNIQSVGLVGQLRKTFLQVANVRAYNDNYNAATFTVHTLESVDAVPSTCTVAGTTAGTYCTTCAYYVDGHEEAELAPHTWSEWTTVVAPTFTAAGSKTHTCSVCEETETAEMPIVTLSVYEEAIVVDNSATVVGVISSADLDIESADKFIVTISYEKDGVQKTVSRIAKSIFTTISGIASTSADTAAAGDLVYIDAGYLFALRLNNVPEGDHTVTVSIAAISGETQIIEVTQTLDFTVV